MNFRFDDEARPTTPVRSHGVMPVSPAGLGSPPAPAATPAPGDASADRGRAPAPAGPRPVRHPARPHRLPERIPASAAWQPGAPAGNRQFIDLGSLYLEAGGQLPAVTMAYETWGELNADASNAVLILHALTGDSHVLGEAGEGHLSAGWWGDLVGPGKAIDTDKYFVVAPNVLGGCQGTTGPASPSPNGSPWGSRFPFLTTRDQVAAEAELADRLGIFRWHAVVGGSVGGHRALEWAAGYPSRVGAVLAIATAAQTSGDQIAWAHPQILAIQGDPKYRGGDYYDAEDNDGPHVGLGIARQIAHTTYRSAVEFDERFGRLPQGGEEPIGGQGRFAVQSYLDHHGGKLARRFDANSYVILTHTMLTHDLGRNRGGVEAALAGISARVLSIGVDSDRLFPAEHAQAIAEGAGGEYVELTSAYGHDGFLIEFDQLDPIVRGFLNEG